MPSFLKKSNRNAEFEEDVSSKEPEVRITKGMYGRLISRRIFQILAFGGIAAIVLYLCFAATWLRIVPTTSGSGLVPIKNVTYEGGILPPGAQVLVDRQDAQGANVIDRFKQAFTPRENAAVVEVISGPYGEMSWAQPGILTVNGEPIGVPFPADSEGKSPINTEDPFLKNQYVAVCISGACEVGEAFIFDKDHIYGSVLARTDIGWGV